MRWRLSVAASLALATWVVASSAAAIEYRKESTDLFSVELPASWQPEERAPG
jgi:hypothetical protein